MIRINLLPVRQIKQRNRARQEVIALVAAFLVLLSVLGLVSYRQASRLTALRAEAVQLKKDSEKFQAVVDLIAKIKKEQQVVEDKMKVIHDLKVASQLPARVLDEIAGLTPANRMWLTSMDYTSNIILLSGTALDNATIAEYMNKVAASAFFLNAELKNSSLIKVGNQKLKSFSMSINVLASLIPVSAAVEPKAKTPPQKAAKKAPAAKK